MEKEMDEKTGKRILLVEDENIIAIVVRKVLKSEGYAVTLAKSGEEALDMCSAEDGFDLVVMDVDLGRGMNGIEAAKEIRGLRALPLVFHTTYEAEDFKEETRGVGAFSWVSKSPDYSRLLRAVEREMGGHALAG
jgi:CheY-like chemotaxis protein